jgi:NADH-quinone oxidoreductase subunit C
MELTALQQQIPIELAQSLAWTEFNGQWRVRVPREGLRPLLETLQRQGFDMLIDVTAVDHLEYPDATDRFEVVYNLFATESNNRLMVSVWLNEPDLTLPSMTDVWSSADWLEREVFDMFGIKFSGHPNLKRLLLPEEFVAFPLRRDYPVKGRGERHNFPVYSRAQS